MINKKFSDDRVELNNIKNLLIQLSKNFVYILKNIKIKISHKNIH